MQPLHIPIDVLIFWEQKRQEELNKDNRIVIDIEDPNNRIMPNREETNEDYTKESNSPIIIKMF